MGGDPFEGLEDLMRRLTGSESREGTSSNMLNDNHRLLYMKYARHAFRGLLRTTREYDSNDAANEGKCEADLRKFVVLLCARVIGGHERELTDRHRMLIGQVLGMEVSTDDFTYAITTIRDRSADTLDKMLPEIVVRQVKTKDSRIFDPAERTIDEIEEFGTKFAEVIGDKRNRRENMVRRMCLEMHTLVEDLRDRLPRDVKRSAHQDDQRQPASEPEPSPPETLDDLRSELMQLVGLDSVKRDVVTLSNFLRVRQLRLDAGLNHASRGTLGLRLGSDAEHATK
jgi:hypothetical protein